MRRLGWLVLAFLLLFSRCPDRLLHPQLYAEDATLFFRGAIVEGLSSVVIPQGRFLEFVPRVIAYVCRPLPWEWIPTAYALAAVGSTLYLVWRVYSARLPLIVALVCSLALLLVPQNAEIWINLCCLHFAFPVLLAVNFLEPAPVSTGESWRRSVEVGAVAFTCPEVFVFAPVMIWWAWRHRAEKMASRMMTGSLAAAAIQLFVMASYPRQVDLNLPQVAGTLGRAMLGYGESFFGGAGDLSTTACQQFIAFVAPVFVLLALADRTNRHRLTACGLLLLAGVLMLFGRIGNIDHFAIWPRPLGTGGRYTYLPFVLAFWALAWLLAGALHHWREGRRLMVLAATIPVLLVPLSAARHWAPLTVPNFHWAQQVREARAGQRIWFVVPPGWRFQVPAAKER